MKASPVHNGPTSKPEPETPAITVVIPAYNAAEFLREAIESVLAQTVSPREVIVVDDGSEDQTPEMTASFAPRVKYIRKQRGGPASARNVGISAARGEWIAFLDSDDLWKPNLLESLVRTASRTHAGLVFCDSRQLIDGNANGPTRLEAYGLKSRLKNLAPNGVLIDPFRLFLEERCYIFTPGVLIRREALLDVGLFDEAFYCGEDLDLWLRLSLRLRFAVTDEVLHLRRVHGKNTGYNWWAKLSGDLQVYEKVGLYATAVKESRKLRRLLNRKKAGAYRDLAAMHLVRVDLAAARQNWAKSLKFSPSPVTAAYWVLSFLPSVWIANALKWRKALKSAFSRPQAAIQSASGGPTGPTSTVSAPAVQNDPLI
jgi:glycosyltransferase involved in cell wall biosynthesis